MAKTLNRRRFLKIGAGAAALPRRGFAAPAPETILVIGAGLAGLSAALRLREARKRVIVLEARGVPGGRVRTMRDLDGGLYGELGAARISDTHEYVLHWLNDFDLSLTPFAPMAGGIIGIHGARAPAEDMAAIERIAPGLHADERRLKPPELLAKYIEGVPGELGQAEIDFETPKLAAFDRVTWPGFLRARGASDAAITLISLGGDSNGFSALFMLRQILLQRGPRGYLKIEGGMDLLPRAIAKALGPAIRYRCEVTRIERSGSGVRAICRENGRTDAVMADRAVIALPFSVLKHITVDPLFSGLKRDAIDTLSYYQATRFLIETKTRFWQAEKLSGGARTDAPADIWDMSFGQKGNAGLLSLTTGGAGMEASLAKMPEEQRRTAGLEMAKTAFPEIGKDQRHMVIQRWPDDPYARGAFSTFRPGEMTRWGRAMGSAEGRVHFAGEHLSPWSGWMEGALWSGDRVAQEILQQ